MMHVQHANGGEAGRRGEGGGGDIHHCCGGYIQYCWIALVMAFDRLMSQAPFETKKHRSFLRNIPFIIRATVESVLALSFCIVPH